MLPGVDPCCAIDSYQRTQNMKRCLECGLENTDAAEACTRCKHREFSFPEPQRIAPPEFLKPKHLLIRLTVAAIVGLVVAGLSLWVAWGNACNAESARPEQYITQHNLRQLANGIETFHKKFGNYPRSLDDVRPLLTNDYFVTEIVNGSPNFVDGWGRPFIFASDGKSCLVTSYGKDGVPGGQGLDCDLTSRDWNPKNARPTFHQFLHDMPVHGMIKSCMVCGGLAGLLALLTIKIPNLEPRAILVVTLKFGATILGATVVAIIISGLHIPSGH